MDNEQKKRIDITPKTQISIALKDNVKAWLVENLTLDIIDAILYETSNKEKELEKKALEDAQKKIYSKNTSDNTYNELLKAAKTLAGLKSVRTSILKQDANITNITFTYAEVYYLLEFLTAYSYYLLSQINYKTSNEYIQKETKYKRFNAIENDKLIKKLECLYNDITVIDTQVRININPGALKSVEKQLNKKLYNTQSYLKK